MKMTLEQFANALQAAYVEGYVQGVAHPRTLEMRPHARVLAKARELAALFWGTCEMRLASRAAATTPPASETRAAQDSTPDLEALTRDAERWRYIRPFLQVDGDTDGDLGHVHHNWLQIKDEFIDVPAGWPIDLGDVSVEAHIDRAIVAASDTRAEDRR